MLSKWLNLCEHGLGFDLSGGPTVKMGAYSCGSRGGDAPTCQREIGQTPPTLLSVGRDARDAGDAKEVTR